MCGPAYTSNLSRPSRGSEEMYCPVGWPRVLVGRGGENGGDPVQLLRHRTKNLVVEVRERSVRVWHSRVRELFRSRTCSFAGYCVVPRFAAALNAR